MEMPIIINSVISLFLIMLVGVYGSKKAIINSNVSKGLTGILLDITLPCMIIMSFSFQYDESVKSNVLKTFYYSFSVYIIIAMVSRLLMLPIKNEKKTILHFANIFSNIKCFIWARSCYVWFNIQYIFYDFSLDLWNYNI